MKVLVRAIVTGFGLSVGSYVFRKISQRYGLEMAWRGEDNAGVWAGGPVAPSTGWVLHEPVGAAVANTGGTIEITSTISLSTSPDRLRVIANQPPRNVRLLLGYSGWGPGQLAQ